MAEPSAPGIILLGVIHHDPLGYKRTGDFLARFQPGLVLVEISPFALRHRMENSPRLYREFLKNLRKAAQNAGISYRAALMNPRTARIGRQLHLPFEYRASAAWCSKTGAEVIPVDWSDYSRQWIATWPELISAENLETLLRLEDMPVPVSKDYDLAARAIVAGTSSAAPPPAGLSGPRGPEREETILMRKREEHIASEVRSAIERRSPHRPLYIGGWRHLVAGGAFRSLRDILGIGLSNCCLLDRGALLPEGRRA